MPFRNAFRIYTELVESPNSEQIAKAFALRSLVQRAIFPNDYVADPRWADAIVPTEAGESLLVRVSTYPIPRGDMRLALFGLFWFQDLLVDPEASNLALVRALVEEEALRCRIFWPLSQGRLLYDRFTALFPGNQDSLTPDEVQRLLSGTPQGVYQVGNLVTGPLGILDSSCARYYPPSMSMGLWHCPMLDCGSLHDVKFQPPPIPLVEGYRLLDTVATQLWKTESLWRQVLARWPEGWESSWRTSSEMPLFLGDCIVADDRTRLVAHVLSGKHGPHLRSLIQSRRPGATKGDPTAVAQSITTDEQLQILLTLSDSTLVALLDQLVWAREIEVPAGEVREVDLTKLRTLSARAAYHLEMSSLGLRATRHSPILLLRYLLLTAYSQAGEMVDLDWRLRKKEGASTQEALMRCLREASPSRAIDTLVLSSPRITKVVAEALEIMIEVPDDRTRALLEWKVGFDLPREDRRLAAIRRVLNGFSGLLESIETHQSDGDREAIRSSGVNAFVEFEGFIDELIAYLAWLLSSDHPKSTRFIYSRSAAMSAVPEILGRELSSGGGTVLWAPSGNTLGVSLRYLLRLNEWLRELPASDRTIFRREHDEVHGPLTDDVRVFPFHHVQLWADASPAELSHFSALVSDCTAHLQGRDIPAIRNGLDHYREPERFPPTQRILEAASAVRDFVESAMAGRLIPKLYWLSRASIDAYDHQVYELVDSDGNVLVLHLPRTVLGLLSLSSLSSTRPVLVAPGNLLGMPGAELVFGVRPDSVYSAYWNEYPARRAGESASDVGAQLVYQSEYANEGDV